jgi:endonuclease/exonuclease/phosphatase (EEP) superfamily protein YafD
MPSEHVRWQRWLPLCLLLALLLSAPGDRSVRHSKTSSLPSFRLLTYNVDWNSPRPDLAVEVIRNSGADIVCLQETTPRLEWLLRIKLARAYPFAAFRDSKTRTGGGCAFLSKVATREIVFIPSESGWFAGWIMAFETSTGPVQVLNLHLRPPVGDDGKWNSIVDYFSTSKDRLREVERFFAKCQPGLPILVAGDFNDGDGSLPVDWLSNRLTNALSQFDKKTPTWRGRLGNTTLNLRLDHVFYSSQLRCRSARVIRAGVSDHFPVEAVFTRSLGTAP